MSVRAQICRFLITDAQVQGTLGLCTVCSSGFSRDEIDANKESAKNYLDDMNWPLIWNNFSAADYITGYAEDSAYSTYNYLKKGFRNAVSFSTPAYLLDKAIIVYTHTLLLELLSLDTNIMHSVAFREPG